LAEHGGVSSRPAEARVRRQIPAVKICLCLYQARDKEPVTVLVEQQHTDQVARNDVGLTPKERLVEARRSRILASRRPLLVTTFAVTVSDAPIVPIPTNGRPGE
jgi:hypothetical protein